MLGSNSDCADNESNPDNDMIANEDITSKTDNFISVHHWIREHYTKLLKNNIATCNYCNVMYTLCNSNLAILHKHLVQKHSEKLNGEQKKEDKFHWTWDYFIPKSDTEAICNKCNRTLKYHTVSDLRSHLIHLHKYVYFK